MILFKQCMFFFVNFLTFSRFLTIPLIGYLHSHGSKEVLFEEKMISHLQFVLVLYSGLTDFLDGYLSRRFEVTSRWGAVADHLADKLFVCLTLYFLQVFYRFPTNSFSVLMKQESYFDIYFLLVLLTFIRELVCSGLKEAFNQVKFRTTKMSKIKTTTQFCAIVCFYSSVFAWIGFFFLLVSVVLGYLSLGLYIQQIFHFHKSSSSLNKVK